MPKDPSYLESTQAGNPEETQARPSDHRAGPDPTLQQSPNPPHQTEGGLTIAESAAWVGGAMTGALAGTLIGGPIGGIIGAVAAGGGAELYTHYKDRQQQESGAPTLSEELFGDETPMQVQEGGSPVRAEKEDQQP